MRLSAPRAAALMAASGFAALGYQVAWTQQAALWLGHESAAVLAVVAAFFGGLAVGAFALGARIEESARPAHWYAACEAAIGGWAVVLAFVLRPASGALLALIGPDPSPAWHWSIAFAGTFLLLLPATAAMGATMPAMERMLAACRTRERIALVYAANTAGAIAGVVLAAFWLVPRFGLTATAIACATLNFACAALAWRLPATAAEPAARSHVPASVAILAATGFLGIGYEVLVVRALSQVCENTVFTFAILLAVYLAGTAAGAEAWRRASRWRSRDAWLVATALACACGVLLLSFAAPVKAQLEAMLGAGFGAALAIEAALALAAFGLPTFAMGALFAQLATEARERGTAFSRALAVNTLGAAAAPMAFGLLALPWLGMKAALLALAGGYFFLLSRRAWTRPAAWAAAGALLAAAWISRPLPIVEVPPGGRVVSSVEGALGHVTVVADDENVLTLHIDNREREGSSATRYADSRQATLPLSLHPAPRRALFLGLGSGVTAYSAAQVPGVQVDAVELLPEVIGASRHFTDGFERAPRLVNADARRFVRAGTERYDVIVADNFHPARSGSGSLYTVEHFEAVKARLAKGGLFCQWLPLHQLDLGTLAVIVRAFRAAFPEGRAMLATNSLDTPVVGLVGVAEPRGFESAGTTAALESLGAFIAGPAALERLARDAELNTDDHPVVAYRAPRLAYTASAPRDRLILLLHRVTITPDDLLAAPRDPAFGRRLAAYWAARDRFIEAGRGVQPTGDVRRMLAQVREPLLAVLAMSPDFSPAYEPLLRMAIALAPQDPPAARQLLEHLQALQPARPEASLALRALPPMKKE